MNKNYDLDFERLLKLRLVVARFGEMDSAQWWNTGNSETAILGKRGARLMERGFPKTYRFAQARVVFAVAKARSAEVFNPPNCMTLWSLPPEIEDQFDSHWATWLEEREKWSGFFEELQNTPNDLLASLKYFELLDEQQEEVVKKLRRSAEGKAVSISGFHSPTNETITLLAAGFSKSEVGRPAIPYARLED